MAEIDESNRVYVRRGGKLKRVYRCPSGFRKGQAVANPATSFAPRKRASTRNKIAIASRRKSAIRVTKSRITNRKASHFRLKKLNNMLRGRR